MSMHYAQNRKQLLSRAEIIKTGGKMEGKGIKTATLLMLAVE